MMHLAPRGGTGRGQGRKPKNDDEQKRQQVAFSLYADDLERLDQLTSNRSEFLRRAISDAWQVKETGKIVVLMTPAQLDALRDLVGALGTKRA